ncbi:hypothetical protein [Flavobacterium sp.]
MNEEKKPEKADENPKPPTNAAIGRKIVVKGNVSRVGNSPNPPKKNDK